MLAGAACAIAQAAKGPAAPLVIGYYPFWTIYQNQNSLAEIPFDQLTHLTYAYAQLDADGNVLPGDYVADLSFAYNGPQGAGSVRGTFAKLREIKAAHPQLKTLISIGGWSWSAHYPAVAADPTLRQHFVQSALAFIDRFGFDGVEIDWQYPVIGGGDVVPRADDQVNKIKLLQALRGALDAHGQRSGRHYLLSTTLGVSGTQLAPPLTRDEVAAVDFAMVDAYDFQGNNAHRTAHSAPLYGRNAQDARSVAQALQLLQQRGVPTGKLVLVLDLEATSWTGVPATGNGLYQSATGMPFGSWDDTDTGPTGTFTASEVLYMKADPAFNEYWDARAHASYLYSAGRRQFVTFESPRAAQDKLVHADQAGLAGIALWQLGSDAPGAHSLLRQVYRHYHPWRGRLDLAMAYWRGRPVWVDPLLGVLATLLTLGVLLLLRWHYLRYRARQREALTVLDIRSQLWALLPLLHQLQQEFATDQAQAPQRPGYAVLPALPGIDALREQARLVERQLAPLALAGRVPIDADWVLADEAAVSATTQQPLPPTSSLAERLEALNRLTQVLGEQRSVEKMLETVMGFLAAEARVRSVVVLQDGETQQQAGDWPPGADAQADWAGRVAGGDALQFSVDRSLAWANVDDSADQQLAIAFHAPASAEDEALLRHLLAQIALIRQHLNELTRQPHVLAELYEIASRRERLLFIRADKGYSGIYCQDGAMPLYVTLRLRTIRLYFPGEMLLQVHRSYLVNPRRVSRAEHKGRGQYELRIGKEAIPVRRQYIARLRALYPAWFDD
ncbi:Chitinase A1 [Andreprevotia sp. IGB-42]|uniref:glycosyl hydrolase family 18 protein n=1 Tax=Andreprevotia sp. IGB-42 TaxID=2497473 RepID=UPI00135A3F3B|nr:glycosyl hydrolase family 18 protein [Andreprevotia sp. IGB-42]KAF0811695.1 Chitinase A1 [Andreprevotia sp. IGB-42]